MTRMKRFDERADAPRVSSEILDRLPPQNTDAEMGVIGSLLLDPDMFEDVIEVVRPQDFYVAANQIVFGHLLAMRDGGQQIDALLLTERLKQQGMLESIGGLAYLAEVAQAVPTAANAAHYAHIVRNKATLRALIHASTETLRDAYDESAETERLLDRAEEKLFSIREDRVTGDLKGIREILDEALRRIDSRLTRGADSGGMPTGFTDLDSLTGGFHESELSILAARPSMGKTALAVNIAEHVAIDGQRPTLFVSLEMSAMELAERLLCSRGRINGHKLRQGFISASDRRKLVEVYAEMCQAPLFIDDTPSRTMTEIAASARRLKRRNNLALVVIDYLQMIEPDNPKDPRQEQVAKIARRLKGMARELKIPVLCLAQLNRQAEVSKDNRPRLSHLRESGAIEQDADVVMFVHRDEYYQTNEEDRARVAGEADIIVAKQRNGPTGDLKLVWLHDYTRFENLARESYDFD